MNKAEAKLLLSEELKKWRERTYEVLAHMVDEEPATREILASSGVHYQTEIRVVWDDAPGGDVRVLGAIDDGGIRAYFPLTDSFIMAPDGTFVDEDTPGAE